MINFITKLASKFLEKSKFVRFLAEHSSHILLVNLSLGLLADFLQVLKCAIKINSRMNQLPNFCS